MALPLGAATPIAALVQRGLPANVPVDLTREQAHLLAARELADPAYQQGRPNLIQRAIDWVVERISDVADRAAQLSPGGWVGLVGLIALVVLGVLVARWRLGPSTGSGLLQFQVDPSISAAQYRAQAEALAADGRWADAVSTRMRALVRRGQERGLVGNQAGWTADEVAATLAERLPGSAGPLTAAARTFDEVRYGGRPADRAAYQVVAAADLLVESGTPSPGPIPVGSTLSPINQGPTYQRPMNPSPTNQSPTR